MIVIFGFTTPGRSEAPRVVYCGNSGTEANAAAEKSTFPRLERLVHPRTRNIRGWTPDRAKAHEEAMARESTESGLESESQRFLQGRVESQRAEIDELRVLLCKAEEWKVRAEMDNKALADEKSEMEQAKTRLELELVAVRAELAKAQGQLTKEISDKASAAAESGSSLGVANPTLAQAGAGEVDDGPSLLPPGEDRGRRPKK